ncbi:chemotaxis protein CheB [Zavarzinella formosa]|uniref:chemotaxis protein CheB n=1 Tax=Zavarzinella formosa TaxID=360055 RepID=UPI0002E83AC3|nr:chemotaxis protein CheB [Zavarzinella formosa]
MTGPSARAVVIGASSGALEALLGILPGLPKGYPLPIMVVVHVPPDRKSLLAEILGMKCRMGVREAEDKEPVCAGTVYLAPPDYHLLAETENCLSLSSEEPVHYSRPSIDVLFESAADVYGPGLIGIILSGGSDDGARGLQAIRQAGGTALVQRPSLALVPVMPQAALDVCPDARSLSLEEITACLLEAATV